MSDRAAALQRLRSAPWLKATPLGRVFDALDATQGVTRVVGGAVRDTLIDMAGAGIEIDLATTLRPDEVMERARAVGITAIPTGVDFGTVTLAHDGTSFEVTSLRHDIETDGRHAVVRFGSDWTEDAARRDFTLNALYCGPDGELFDPLGGLGDCLGKRVRFIGDAATRIREDRLRVFRFFRFSASHGGEHFDRDGLAASAAAADALGPLSAERIGHEMSRILELPRCAKTLRTMTDAGVFAVEAETLARLGRYERVTRQPELAGRLAILAGAGGPDSLKARWRLSNAVVRKAEAVAAAARLIGDGKLREAAYRHAGDLAAATGVAGAESGWSAAECTAVESKLSTFAPPPFPVTGAVLVKHGFAAGPALGALLRRLESAWIASDFNLTREDLLALAREEKG